MSDATELYTCPMHPEVRQDHAGSCPRCGMSLEKVPGTATGSDEGGELSDLSRRMWIGGALTLPTVALAMVPMAPGLGATWGGGEASRWTQFVLATPVVWWAGWPFFRRAWSSILALRPNMFTLVGIGVGAAYLSSAAAMLVPGLFPSITGGTELPKVYFEAAAVIVVLVLVGQVLELVARRRTHDAVRALLDLAPPTANRVLPGGDLVVPLERVAIGDRLRVLPGAQVPVDGEVVEGSSNLDESMITGEPVPVGKGPGDQVTGGTVNGSGSFVLRAERIGEDTMLGRIVEMVSQASRSRAPVQGLADKVSAVFVPLVLVTSLLTFVFWMAVARSPGWGFALVNAVAVLVVACPCALGLATPMSILVGVGRGAREGVLVKSAEALERLESVDTLVIDKTGTLTAGRPEVVEILPEPGVEAEALLGLAAALERHSEHPLAAAVVASAQRKGMEVGLAEGFESIAGAGVRGTVWGRKVAIGTPAFLRGEGVPGLGGLETSARKVREVGRTAVFVALDGRAAGVLALADPIKPEARAALRELRALGLSISMVTGDHHVTAWAVAGQVGVERVEAEVDPARKAEIVKALRAGGARVAMVGDGVNDALALMEADVGIAMGTGTDVAIQSAGITLLRGDLAGIARAVRLSRATLSNIRQNLFFAFAYNAVGIPVAAGALYPTFGLLLSPVLAGAAMSLSSVSVIANALRLRNTNLSAG